MNQRGERPICADKSPNRTFGKVQSPNPNSDLDSSPKNPGRGSGQKSKVQFGLSPIWTFQFGPKSKFEVQKYKSEVQIQIEVQIQTPYIMSPSVQVKSKSGTNQVQIPRSPKVQIGLGPKSKYQVQNIHLGRSSSPEIWTSVQSSGGTNSSGRFQTDSSG